MEGPDGGGRPGWAMVTARFWTVFWARPKLRPIEDRDDTTAVAPAPLRPCSKAFSASRVASVFASRPRRCGRTPKAKETTTRKKDWKVQ